MRLVALLGIAFGIVACGSGDSQVCPTGWNADTTAPGGCTAPASYTSSLPGGVYGFVRTFASSCPNADAGSGCTGAGKNELVVGTLVFAVADTNTTCQAPSVNPIAQTTTDGDGLFSMPLPPGTYRITSGKVPSCVEVTVDATAPTEVALTYP